MFLKPKSVDLLSIENASNNSQNDINLLSIDDANNNSQNDINMSNIDNAQTNNHNHMQHMENSALVDIGVYENFAALSEETMYNLATNHFIPPKKYPMPFTERRNKNKKGDAVIEKRYANADHLNDYKPWLIYSPTKKGFFCLPCALMATKRAFQNKIGNLKLGQFVVEPFTNFTKSVEQMNKHMKNDYHILSVTQLENFKDTMANTHKNIANIYKNESKSMAKFNRSLLEILADTILTIGKQGLALRGTKDYGSLNSENDKEYNTGNFRNLLMYRQRGGDPILNDSRFTNQYLSPTIQNELVEIIYSLNLKHILKKIKKSMFYSIIFDETSDLSKKEQMVLVIRYFDIEKCCIVEDFIGFFDCYNLAKKVDSFSGSLTGKVLGSIVIDILNYLNLPLDRLVGVATDTCNVMAGAERGAVAQIKKDAKFAVHSPCLNHLVNLSVKLICSRPEIDQYMQLVQDLYNFFKYPKRNDLLQTHTSGETHKQLAKTVLTRWTSAANATSTLIELILPVKKSLDECATWENIETQRDLCRIINRLNADFIINLLLLDKILHTVNPLVNLLQRKNLVISDAHNLIKSTIESLKNTSTRSGIFDKIYLNAEKLCLELGLEIRYNRNFDRLANMNHYQTKFKDNVEYFIKDLESRTTKKEEAFFCLDEIYHKTISEAGFDYIANNYATFFDSPTILFTKELKAEYQQFKEIEITGELEKDIPLLQKYFKIIPQLLIILAVCPPSVATAERCFSCLRRLKTWLRTTTGQERLQGLASMNLIDQNPPIARIVDKFAVRRKDFIT